jgi:hypothetical protein
LKSILLQVEDDEVDEAEAEEENTEVLLKETEKIHQIPLFQPTLITKILLLRLQVLL